MSIDITFINLSLCIIELKKYLRREAISIKYNGKITQFLKAVGLTKGALLRTNRTTVLRKMEKSVVLLSNAVDVFPNNKLNHFENAFQSDFLEKHITWMVSVECISIDLKIKNNGSSRKNAFPSILSISVEELLSQKISPSDLKTKDISLKIFDQHHCFYIDDQTSYTSEHLNYLLRWCSYINFKKNPLGFYGFVSKMNKENEIEFGQFENPKENEDAGKQTILFFNYNFARSIELSNITVLEECFINDEKYFFIRNSDSTPLLKSLNNCDGLKMKYPKVINICSKKIKSNANNPLCSMKRFSVDQNDIGKYVSKTFVNHEYHLMNFNNISSYDLYFTNEKGEKLRLLRGYPTIVKLRFKSSAMTLYNTIPLSVNSLESHYLHSNKTCSFRITLAEKLNLNSGKFEVGVSAITYKNAFHMLSIFNLGFSIINHTDEIEEESFFIPKHLKNVAEIREHFFQAIKNITDFEIDKNDRICLLFKKKCTLKIGRDLSHVLGSKCDEEFLVIDGNTEKPYNFDVCPQNINLWPPVFFVYCNIVTPSLLGERFCQLLKICTIEQSKKNQFITQEFDSPQFFECMNTEIRELHFEIRSHNGESLIFDADSAIFLDLVFRKSV